MKAYPTRTLNSRGAAALGLASTTLLVAALSLGDFASLWIFLAALACVGSAVWAAAVYLGSSEFVSIDLSRAVVVSGVNGKEHPLSRLSPLALRKVGGSGPEGLPRAGRWATMPYQVLARGLDNHVLYQSFSRARAERKLEQLTSLFAGAEFAAAEKARLASEARERGVAGPGAGADVPRLRERLAALAVFLLISAVGVGILAWSPVLEYDCTREANGAVGCVVHRRVAGLVPLGDVEVPGVVRVSVRRSRSHRSVGDLTPRTDFDSLVLVGAAGAEWRSPWVEKPYGYSNTELGRAIESLLGGSGPGRFVAGQGETSKLVLGGVVAGLPVLLLLVGFVLSRTVVRPGSRKEASG